MGKIKVAALGSSEEEKLREERKVKREEKKKRESADRRNQQVHLSGMKGGERLKTVGGGEDMEKMIKLAEEVEKDQTEGIQTKEPSKNPKKVKVHHRGKSYQQAVLKIDPVKIYPMPEALKLLRDVSYAKFTGSVEVHINTKEKGMRGAVAFPHGTGKEVRVAIADEKMLPDIEAGKINFDVLIAHPSLMPRLAKVARILGPKGLMPNPKNGTISTEPEKAAAKFKKGEVHWKTEPEFPIIHQVIGKMSFKDSQLEENYQALIKSIGDLKINNITLKSSMSPGIKVQL